MDHVTPSDRQAPMKNRPWSPEAIAILIRDYPDTPTRELAERLGRTRSAIYKKVDRLGLRKSAEYLSGGAAGKFPPGHGSSTASRFRPGNIPHNKGKKGWSPGGRAAETRFQPGQRPHTWQPIGSERITAEGYRKRKITDTGYAPRDWVGVHRLLWIARNGQIPEGHKIAFRNGDKTDIRIENLELITQNESMSRNSVHRLPKALAEVCQLKGTLQRQINKRTKAREKQS